MGEHTKIEWTDNTWNPWRGCIKVSEGCKNCYMYRDQRRYGNDPMRVVRAASKTFYSPLKWKEPCKVFTCSWSDFFLESADEWRHEAWHIIRRTPHLTYQILTKRPQNIADRLPSDWRDGYSNVWLGVSAENQRRFDERIGVLLSIPARVHFVSAEPLLGRIDMDTWSERLDWVITGGESGDNHRPVDLRWFEDIAAQCRQTGTPVFVKQDGGLYPGGQGRIPDRLFIHEFPAEINQERFEQGGLL